MIQVGLDEIFTRMGQQLSFSWVIGSFHPNNIGGNTRVMLAQVFEKQGFFEAWPHDQDFLGIADGSRNVVEKPFVFGSVPGSMRAGFRVQVRGMRVSLDFQVFVSFCGEINGMGLGVIYPDYSMICGHVSPSNKQNLVLSA
jgi:hypothetical protein